MSRTEKANLFYFLTFIALLIVWGWMNATIGGN